MKFRFVLTGVIACTAASSALGGEDADRTPETLRLAAAEEQPAPAQSSVEDLKFLQLAIDSGARAVQFSQQAQRKAQSAAVKDFAKLMVNEHLKANRELVSLNARLLKQGGPPYKEADREVKQIAEDLAKLSGADFDRRYMDVMVKDHEAAARLYERQAKSGDDVQLKAVAEKNLPMLRRHLQRARQLMEAVSG